VYAAVKFEDTHGFVAWTHISSLPSEDKLHGGCSGETEKPHYVMKPSCAWISARGQYPKKKITVVKIFDRRKYPQDVQGLTLYVGVVPGL